MYSRAAVEPPRTASFAQDQNYGDEIDREIESYFGKIKSSSSVDLDKQKLDQLFGKELERKEERKSGRHSFSNISRADRSEKDIKSHRVKAGDTVWRIGRKYGIDPGAIITHNPVLRKRALYIGEEILIVNRPNVPAPQMKPRYHRVSKGDSLSKIARKYGISVAQLKGMNRLGNKSAIKAGGYLRVGSGASGTPPGYRYNPLFVWPVKGSITSGFGRRYNPFIRSFSHFHKGIDIGAGMGTTFGAARSGLVIFSDRMGGYGNCIFIRHADGYVSVYGHNKINMVNKGDVVKQGQIIGQIGRTGHATGPHLHFEVRKWKKAMNPMAALKMRELIAVSNPQTNKTTAFGNKK